MKRTIACSLLFSLLFLYPVWAEPLQDADLAIGAPYAVLMEKTTGTLLYEKGAHEHVSPASVTKVMTLLLLFEDLDAGKLALDDTVTASARAASFGGSCVYLEAGEQMSVDEMLKCITVVSANDCAVAMAEHVSGSEEVFVARMNKRAEELGLEDTHFTNCTGLFDDSEHYTSAYDVAVMSRELLRHEGIRRYSTIWMDSIRGGAFGLSNTNKLVYWYEGCTGLKTGFTNEAMYCLSATAERDGVEYIAVVMHAESSDARNADAKALLNYAFANFTLSPLPTALPSLAVEYGKQACVPLALATEERAILIEKGTGAPRAQFLLPESVRAPVREGDELGTLELRQGEELLGSYPLCAAATAERLSFWGIFRRLAASLVGL